MFKMATALFTAIIEALNQPFAVEILTFLLSKGEAKLSDILVFVSGISKYRSVRKTILTLESVGLITKTVTTWGKAKKWHIKLTQLGEKIARSIIDAIKKVIGEF